MLIKALDVKHSKKKVISPVVEPELSVQISASHGTVIFSGSVDPVLYVWPGKSECVT